LIGFATRTKVWNVIYPKRLPAGLLVARWLGVIAIMCGVARFLCNLFFVFSLISGIGSSRPFGPGDGEFLFGVSMIIDQLWWLSFWLTTFTLVAFMSGMLLQRRFQPQPQRR
jgi:hypothetical protein